MYLQYNVNEDIFSENYMLNQTISLQMFCSLNTFCREILKSTQVLYKVSYFINLFVFLNYNTVLKKKFKNHFHRSP